MGQQLGFRICFFKTGVFLYIDENDLEKEKLVIMLRLKSENVSPLVVSDSLQHYGLQPTRSSVHGILQARILAWVAIPFSRGSSRPRYQTQVSCIADRFFTV